MQPVSSSTGKDGEKVKKEEEVEEEEEIEEKVRWERGPFVCGSSSLLTLTFRSIH